MCKAKLEILLTDSLLLVGLHKKYNQLTAVDHISVGIPEQECFGLLGRSGAGKTTIFRMLTGETTVTSGNAFLKGFDVRSNLRKVRTYCSYAMKSKRSFNSNGFILMF